MYRGRLGYKGQVDSESAKRHTNAALRAAGLGNAKIVQIVQTDTDYHAVFYLMDNKEDFEKIWKTLEQVPGVAEVFQQGYWDASEVPDQEEFFEGTKLVFIINWVS